MSKIKRTFEIGFAALWLVSANLALAEVETGERDPAMLQSECRCTTERAAKILDEDSTDLKDRLNQLPAT